MANVYLTDNINTLNMINEHISEIQYVNDYSIETIDTTGSLYLVAYGTYDEIKLRVENENYVGVSLYIKRYDEADTEYRKEIILNNISGNPYILEINYMWKAINHLLILKHTEYNCFINIYVKRKI